MKTLQELYGEVIASDKLKKEFAEAAKSGKTEDFLKANGCEVSEEDLVAFLKDRSGKELTDEELDNAAGGTCNENTALEAVYSTFSAGVLCLLLAALSAATEGAHVGQQNEKEGRICNAQGGI